MPLILDGKIVRDLKKTELAKQVETLRARGIVPTLAIVQVGDVPESNTYIAQKKKFGEEIGAVVRHIRIGAERATSEIVDEIGALNTESSIHGIIVQLPLPASVDRQAILDAVASAKDVDGLGAESVQRLKAGEKGFVPATARGVVSLLRHYGIAVAGKRVTMVGHSVLVGQPLTLILRSQGAIVTVCDIETKDLAAHTKAADIVIVAVGQRHLIGPNHLSSGQTVVDIGINVGSDKKLFGDVDFEAVKGQVAAISPVPGGVGPLTMSCLFENLLDAIL
ncbi:MAG: bifunctional 5,10-methylenetetrahydrofolate dehydrogenase/5,10-methenyltetrahydrofolate cyclohydrolase [bacterium]